MLIIICKGNALEMIFRKKTCDSVSVAGHVYFGMKFCDSEQNVID